METSPNPFLVVLDVDRMGMAFTYEFIVARLLQLFVKICYIRGVILDSVIEPKPYYS